jgi:hypothetical protein
MMLRWGRHIGGSKKPGTGLFCSQTSSLQHKGMTKRLDFLNGEETVPLKAICHQRKCALQCRLGQQLATVSSSALNYRSWEGSVCS